MNQLVRAGVAASLAVGLVLAVSSISHASEHDRTQSQNTSLDPSNPESIGCSTIPAAAETINGMAARLNIMVEVAYSKYVHNISIDDPVREKQQLEFLTDRAAERGIDRNLAEGVFRDQFIGAKQVQWKLFHQWNSGRPLPTHPPLDLSTQLRPLIDQANDSLIDSLQRAQDQRVDREWKRSVETAILVATKRLSKDVGIPELRATAATLAG